MSGECGVWKEAVETANDAQVGRGTGLKPGVNEMTCHADQGADLTFTPRGLAAIAERSGRPRENFSGRACP